MISGVDLEQIMQRLDPLVQKCIGKFWDIYWSNGCRKQKLINKTKQFLRYQESILATIMQGFATRKELQDFLFITQEILRLFKEFQMDQNPAGKFCFLGKFSDISIDLIKKRALYLKIKRSNMEKQALQKVINKYIAKGMKQLNDNEIQSLEISQEDRLAVRTINEH